MARDGETVSGALSRRKPGEPRPDEAREPADFGRLQGGPLNQWKVEERRG